MILVTMITDVDYFLYLNETQAELWRKLKLMKSVDNVRTLCYDMFIFCSKVIELNN